MIVIFAEKPDMGRKIANVLGLRTRGDGYITGKWNGEDTAVTWGFGHMCTLKHAKDYNPDYKRWSNIPLPFIPEQYEIMICRKKGVDSPDPGIVKQLKLVKSLFLKPGARIICATDDDREGELIWAYVCDIIRYNGPHERVLMSSTTDDGLRKTFNNIRNGSEFYNLALAGRARAIADWVVGINLTTATTLQYQARGGPLSVGRVQTATLNMLVERELAIRNHTVNKFYTINAEFMTADGDVYHGQHANDRFESKDDANAILNKIIGQQGTVIEVKKRVKNYTPPLLYSQTTLQMAANSVHGLTMQQTLDASQSLYEKGYLTYPRTSSQYLTDDMKPVMKSILTSLKGTNRYGGYLNYPTIPDMPDHVFDNSKVESHYAIVPTEKLPTSIASANEAAVYDLVVKSVIRLVYPDAQVENTLIKHDVAGESFISKGSRLVNEGWFAVDAMPSLSATLPSLKTGDTVAGAYSIKEGHTEPPKRYTDKTLVAAMAAAGKNLKDAELRKILADGKDGGIGTGATRAAIVEALVGHGYITRQKKQFYVTDAGIQLIQVLPIEDIKSPEITAVWEKRLKAIELGNEPYESFIRDIEAATRNWCRTIQNSTGTIQGTGENSGARESVGTCPICGKPLYPSKVGISCSGWRDGCKFKLWRTVCGKTLTDNQLKTLASGKQTALIKGFKKKNGSGTFDAKLYINEEYKIKFKFENRDVG